jgi:hypothetical protein
MSLAAAEFQRLLPVALASRDYEHKGEVITVRDGERRVLIRCTKLQELRIASLCLPRCRVTFSFSGYTVDDARQFLADFLRHYQRGGG